MQRQGRVEVLQCLGGLPQLEAHATQRVVGARLLRVQRDNTQKRLQRALKVACVFKGSRQIEEHLGAVRGDLTQLPVRLQSLFGVAGEPCLHGANAGGLVGGG